MCRAMVHTSQVQMSNDQSGFVTYAYQARVIADTWYLVLYSSVQYRILSVALE